MLARPQLMPDRPADPGSELFMYAVASTAFSDVGVSPD
jgi:hypothetical protein